MKEYYLAIHKCCERYRDMMLYNGTKVNDPLWVFTFELMFSCRDESIPITKANRWLGYIQGRVIERGFTTVQEERDATRPLFRPLDYAEA